MGFVEEIDLDQVIDHEEENRGFHREINHLLQINSRNDYYIEEQIFGYGLEIEVSAKVARTHFIFLKAMLNNIINAINYRGNFVFDRTIIGDYGFEICLDPLEKEECIKIYSRIREIIEFSGDILNVEPKNSCGLHINIKADERIKAEKFEQLFSIIDAEDNECFVFNEYKKIIDVEDYETYLNYQKEVSSKYLAVNLLKPNLIELRCVNPKISMENFEKLLNKIENVFGGNDESSYSSSEE